jgi:hypothetical protein
LFGLFFPKIKKTIVHIRFTPNVNTNVPNREFEIIINYFEKLCPKKHPKINEAKYNIN